MIPEYFKTIKQQVSGSHWFAKAKSM